MGVLYVLVCVCVREREKDKMHIATIKSLSYTFLTFLPALGKGWEEGKKCV